MSNNDAARKLLVDSYIASVNRIRASIHGSQTGSANPYGITGEVVGLCGQGGKHSYFRIPISVLEFALDRIERASSQPFAIPSSPMIERILEEIIAACQDLRQQTYFDTGTGCVNDTLPSMVPLLPPEEIWFDGRVLPMDVWRLISYEFDLVSSSVASQVSVQDFAFSAVSQSALAFRLLINQLGDRRVGFEVELDKVPAPWISFKTKTNTLEVSLARVFFEAGSLLTPLADQDFIKWYGAIRYLHWIDTALSELRVKNEFDADSVDCRYRGLFAEETAIGLMAIVLNEIFGASPINNTVEVLPPNSIERGQPIADFIARAKNPTTFVDTTIIAESKGSLGNSVSKARYERAKQQLKATNLLVSGTAVTLPLAFGSTIRFSRQRLKSHCFVTDPPNESTAEPTYINPQTLWRVAYAKAFKFVGLEPTSQQVLRGDPAEAIRPIDFDRQRDRRRNDRDIQRLRRAENARRYFEMDLLLDVGDWAVGLDLDLASILRHGIDLEASYKIEEILSSRRVVSRERFHGASFETSLGLGCISYAELDGENSPEIRSAR